MPARAFRAVPFGIYYSVHLTGPLLSVTGVYWLQGVRGLHALPTQADCDAVAAVVAAWVNDAVAGPKSKLPPQATVDQVRAWSQAEEGGPESSVSLSVVGSGTAATDIAPAVLLKMETNIHARGKFGRVFFGPCPGEGIGSNGYWDPTYLAKVVDSWAALQAALNDASFINGVLSQKYGIIYPINAVVGSLTVAYQTRRGTGRD